MRGSFILLAALAAMLTPAMASAQTQKPDPFVIEENDMMGRHPRLAEDKLVAPDAGGELTGVRGKAWWQVLSWCVGVYRFHHNELSDAGDAAGAKAMEEAGKRFILLAIGRLMTDRRISADDTVAILTPEASYGIASAADGGETYRPFAVDDMRCRDVERSYRAAGLAN
jgi:hypothetical protein